MTPALTIRLALFLAASAWFVYVSRASLRVPRSHGFYRFFVWESILALFLVNVGEWFRSPLSLRQVVSWVCLVASGFLAVHAVSLLRVVGRPDGTRHDVPLLELEKTTTLVTVGAYRYIRHPLYSSLLLLAWGIFLKSPTWHTGGLVAAATGFLLATAKADEAATLKFFGAAYAEYTTRTRMFIPFLF